jgi:hypothetical protein
VTPVKPEQRPGALFRPGSNIAMKVPAFEYDRTVAFYRDILQLAALSASAASTVFDFGERRLWIDRCEHISQAEIWLEVTCADVAAARDHLTALGVRFCDDIESLPADVEGFWIVNPGNVVHLVRRG